MAERRRSSRGQDRAAVLNAAPPRQIC
jgi:hypothetical protein